MASKFCRYQACKSGRFQSGYQSIAIDCGRCQEPQLIYSSETPERTSKDENSAIKRSDYQITKSFESESFWWIWLFQRLFPELTKADKMNFLLDRTVSCVANNRPNVVSMRLMCRVFKGSSLEFTLPSNDRLQDDRFPWRTAITSAGLPPGQRTEPDTLFKILDPGSVPERFKRA